MSWSLPSGDQLFERARRSSGAAGVDSWSGNELSSLPLVVMEVFSAISRRWVLAGAAPAQFSECRMVLLPKEAKLMPPWLPEWPICVPLASCRVGGDFGLVVFFGSLSVSIGWSIFYPKKLLWAIMFRLSSVFMSSWMSGLGTGEV